MDRARRLLLDHRRLLAALCAGLAVLLALGSVRSSADGVAVVVADRDLPSGSVLDEDDVRLARLPRGTVPDGAAGDAAEVVGRTVGGPVRRGEVLTDARVVGPGDLVGRPAGTVLATVPVADARSLPALRVGDRVDVVAVSAEESGPRAAVVARSLEVAVAPRPADDGSATVGLAAPRDVALDLAEAGLESRLGLLPGG